MELVVDVPFATPVCAPPDGSTAGAVVSGLLEGDVEASVLLPSELSSVAAAAAALVSTVEGNSAVSRVLCVEGATTVAVVVSCVKGAAAAAVVSGTVSAVVFSTTLV